MKCSPPWLLLWTRLISAANAIGNYQIGGPSYHRDQKALMRINKKQEHYAYAQYALCSEDISHSLLFLVSHPHWENESFRGSVCLSGGGPHPLMRQQVAHVVITHCRRAVPLGSLEMATGHAQLNKLTSWSNHCPHRRKNVHQTQPHISIISYTHYPIKWVFFLYKNNINMFSFREM